MEFTGKSDIDRALQGVGEILASEGQAFAIVVTGGAALNLLGIVERSTTDVDILAFAQVGAGPARELRRPPEPLPEQLLHAARAVARDMDLGEDWLNAGPSLQWLAGLPPGLEQRVRWREYSALTVGVVDREDFILAAKAWVSTQDASPAFAEVLTQVVECVHGDLTNDDKSPGTGH